MPTIPPLLKPSLEVPCPRCKATPKELCKTARGLPMYLTVHSARFAEAARLRPGALGGLK